MTWMKVQAPKFNDRFWEYKRDDDHLVVRFAAVDGTLITKRLSYEDIGELPPERDTQAWRILAWDIIDDDTVEVVA